MVTLLLLAVATTVTTARPAAAQSGCTWPVTNNQIDYNWFNTDVWAEFNSRTYAGFVPTAITGQPCSFAAAARITYGGSNMQRFGEPTVNGQGNLVVSFWHRTSTPGAQFRVYRDNEPNSGGVNIASGSDWQYTQVVMNPIGSLPTHRIFIGYGLYSPSLANGVWHEITGISVVLSSPTAIPTATATPLSATATPSGVVGTPVSVTATPSGVVGTPVSVTATPAGIVGTAVAVTATPSSGINNPPMPGVTVTPYRLPTRIPREPITPFEQLVYGPDGKDTILADLPPSVADLPALPAAIQGSGELTDMPLPEIDGAAVGTQVLGLTRGITKLVFDHPLWTPIRWIGYTFLSISLLGLLIYK